MQNCAFKLAGFFVWLHRSITSMMTTGAPVEAYDSIDNRNTSKSIENVNIIEKVYIVESDKSASSDNNSDEKNNIIEISKISK